MHSSRVLILALNEVSHCTDGWIQAANLELGGIERAGEPAPLVLALLQLDRPRSRQWGLDQLHLTTLLSMNRVKLRS